MSSYWLQHCLGAGSFLIALALLTFAAPLEDSLPEAYVATRGFAGGKEKPWAERKSEEMQKPADYFVDLDQSGYRGLTITRRLRKVLETEGYETSQGKWINVGYVDVRDGNKLVKTFDADVYFALGNSADFGFFPFLSGGNKQLFISQDVFRRGRQWVVSLYPKLKILFDGEALCVGREGYDLNAVDLDDDGTFEIMVPVTDTYEFHDKMSMSQIPLPTIVFKYDPDLETYLPANALFKNYVYADLQPVGEPYSSRDMEHRSTILNNLFVYIYAGEEERGWNFFNRNYPLQDKEEIRSRVREILRDQPVYNLIYKRRKRK